MKNNLLFILLLLSFGCKNDQSATVTETDECIDSIATTTVFGNDTVNLKPKIPVTDTKTLAGRDIRAGKSVVKGECCASLKDMQPCCCDEVAKKYKSFLQKNDFDGAVNLKSKDPYYLACQESGKAFENKIEAIEIEILGNE